MNRPREAVLTDYFADARASKPVYPRRLVSEGRHEL